LGASHDGVSSFPGDLFECLIEIRNTAYTSFTQELAPHEEKNMQFHIGDFSARTCTCDRKLLRACPADSPLAARQIGLRPWRLGNDDHHNNQH